MKSIKETCATQLFLTLLFSTQELPCQFVIPLFWKMERSYTRLGIRPYRMAWYPPLIPRERSEQQNHNKTQQPKFASSVKQKKTPLKNNKKIKRRKTPVKAEAPAEIFNKQKWGAVAAFRSKHSKRYMNTVARLGVTQQISRGWLHPNQNVSHSTTRQLESCARESTANTKKQAPSVVPRFKPRGSSQGNALASCTHRRSIN